MILVPFDIKTTRRRRGRRVIPPTMSAELRAQAHRIADKVARVATADLAGLRVIENFLDGLIDIADHRNEGA